MSEKPSNNNPAVTAEKPASEKLREAIQLGIDQADQGEVAPLDIQGTLARVRSRRKDDEKV